MALGRSREVTELIEDAKPTEQRPGRPPPLDFHSLVHLPGDHVLYGLASPYGDDFFLTLGASVIRCQPKAIVDNGRCFGSTSQEIASARCFWVSQLQIFLGDIAMMEDTVVRCPYCMHEGHFRGMVRYEHSNFVCVQCGHTVVPEDQSFRCTCVKCWENDPSVYRYPRLAPFAIDENTSQVSRIPCKPPR
jgi:hypothetical protein